MTHLGKYNKYLVFEAFIIPENAGDDSHAPAPAPIEASLKIGHLWSQNEQKSSSLELDVPKWSSHKI